MLVKRTVAGFVFIVDWGLFLWKAFICTTNVRFIHDAMLWKRPGCTAGFLVLCIVPTIFYMLKVKVMSYYIYRLFGIGTAGKSL